MLAVKTMDPFTFCLMSSLAAELAQWKEPYNFTITQRGSDRKRGIVQRLPAPGHYTQAQFLVIGENMSVSLVLFKRVPAKRQRSDASSRRLLMCQHGSSTTSAGTICARTSALSHSRRGRSCDAVNPCQSAGTDVVHACVFHNGHKKRRLCLLPG